MTAPVMAVAGMHSPDVRGLRRDGVVAARRVVEAVRRAGGEPVILPPSRSPKDVTAVADRCHGLVLPGGADLDPACYGSRTPAADDGDRMHDDTDIALARWALRTRMPLLAICRGMQVLNVALGGTLLEEVAASSVEHHEGFHRVELDPACTVAAAMGTECPIVSSYHHQAIDRLGDELRVSGRAADGCIEAVEHDSGAVLAVQWHPEDDAEHQPYNQALFDAVVARSAHLDTATTGGQR